MSEPSWKICPLCERPIPPRRESKHHLVPKVKGGAKGEVAVLHPICHAKIHSLLGEAELARNYATIEALRSHPEMRIFLKWVAKRPPDFHSRTAGGRRRRR